MDQQTSPLPTLPLPEEGELTDDPAILALLDFEPTPVTYKRKGNWTAELQRQFITLLALLGSPAQAAEVMGRCRYGAEKLYKREGSEGFRGAWDAALELFEKRDAMRLAAERVPWAGVRPPGGIDKRLAGDGARDGAKNRQGPAPGDEAEHMSEEGKLELLANIGVKFLRKIAQEREARLAGQIVTADFYLRQITMIEITIDLMSQGLGAPWDFLAELRRGPNRLMWIAETPFSRMLDTKRREFWESRGEPMRPDIFQEEFMRDFGDHRTQAEQNAYGGVTEPARGYSAEQWAVMSIEQQKAARQAQFDADAAAQVAWEQAAYADYEARRTAGEEGRA